MLLLALCMVGHLMLAGVLPSPWWVPNLTLAGLVLAVLRAPRQWLLCSGAAGAWMALWAVRHPAAVCVWYLAVGVAVHLLAERWDLSDPRVLGVLVVGAGVPVTYGLLWIDDVWSLPLIALAAGHVLVTGLSASVISPLLSKRR